MKSIYGAHLITPDGQSVIWEMANRNKKGVVLDLKNKEGRAIFYRLIEKSDVFLTNYRPQALQKMNVDYETLKEYNPKLIYAVTTAFGRKGPFSDKAGYDMTAQAYSGAMWIAGDRDYPGPALTVGSIYDMIAASFLVYGVLAALVARERYGIGQQVESSILAGAVHIQGLNIASFAWTGKGQARFSQKRTRNPLTNYYKCADGKWIVLCEPAWKNWDSICVAMGMQELKSDPHYGTPEDRAKNYAELIATLESKFVTKPRDEWLKIFDQYDFPYAPVNDYNDVVNDPQILANEYVVEIDHAAFGQTKTVGFPVQFSETPAFIQSGAPEFGQHTEEILMEVLGYSWEEIARLRDQGALG
jgi:crotonobetainyl-CoA:carnitine CoA-transferase CaiB-like acyl-CoA transferase